MASMSVGVNPMPLFPMTMLLTDNLPSPFTSRKLNQALISSENLSHRDQGNSRMEDN